MTSDQNNPPQGAGLISGGAEHLPIMGELIDTPDGEALVVSVTSSSDVMWDAAMMRRVRAHTAGHPERFALLHVKMLASGKETTYPSWQVTRRAAPAKGPLWRQNLVATIGAGFNKP